MPARICGDMKNSSTAAKDRFRIVATVDSDFDRATACADQISGKTGWRVTPYRAVEHLLNSETDLDGADICSPHGLHHVLACELLAGGVHILCEKPIGVTVKATQKIIAAAKRHNRIAANAEQCRRSIGQRTIYWAFHSGLLGDPRLWYAIKSGWQDPSDHPDWHWRVDRKLGGVRDGDGQRRALGRYHALLVWEIDSVYARVEQLEARPHQKDDRLVRDAREDFWTSIFNLQTA